MRTVFLVDIFGKNKACRSTELLTKDKNDREEILFLAAWINIRAQPLQTVRLSKILIKGVNFKISK